MASKHALVVRGTVISEDSAGNICLDDLWRLARANENKAPKQWRRTKAAEALTTELQKKVTNSHIKENSSLTSVIYSKKGRGNSGTYAHPVLAAAYAGYLSPKLEIEIREIWLRYRAGDAALADEILQRASAEANLWAGRRAISRAQRKSYTDTLKAHGVKGHAGYIACTEALYLNLLGGKSYQLRAQMGLPAKANLRDNFDVSRLSFVAAAEALSSERIEDEGSQGNIECANATAKSAATLRRAIEDDRRQRQPKLTFR